MIVQINPNNTNEYQRFLAEAYQYLDDRGQLHDYDKNDAEKTFEDISQYYNYIEYFKVCDKSAYFLLKMPLNEGAISINADTRSINLDNSPFKKGAVVQRDKNAEMVVFTIDRFIDNMDLANADQIYVQWTAPDGYGGVREKATPIELIDLEGDENGQIKFGWPIDDEVTLYNGIVQFSVTFFKFDPNKTNSVEYRLNTLPASFEVKKALQPEINAEKDLNRPYSDFLSSLRNNNYPGKGVKPPSRPTFSAPQALDLPKNGIVEIESQLKAQAVTGVEKDSSSLGTIQYQWTHTPEGSHIIYYCQGGTYVSEEGETITQRDYDLISSISDYTEIKDAFTEAKWIDENENEITEYTFKESKNVSYKPFGIVKYAYVKTNPKDFQLGDKIYTASDENLLEKDEDNNFKDIYYEQATNAPGTFIILSEDLDKTQKVLFEKYTYLELPSGETVPVVGNYQVIATNTKGTVESPSVGSTTCTFKGPEKITFKKDLPKEAILSTNKTFSPRDSISKFDNSLGIQLTYQDIYPEYQKYFETIDEETGDKIPSNSYTHTAVNPIDLKTCILSIDLNYNEENNYNIMWQKKTTKNGNYADISTSTNQVSIGINEPAWYRAKVSSKKNRKSVQNISQECMVKSKPLVPTIIPNKTYIDNQGFSTTLDNSGSILIPTDDKSVELKVTSSILNNNINVIENPLYSSGIEYRWEKFTSDTKWEVLTSTIDSSEKPSGDAIKVPSVSTGAMTYRCIAKNKVINNVTGDIFYSIESEPAVFVIT